MTRRKGDKVILRTLSPCHPLAMSFSSIVSGDFAPSFGLPFQDVVGIVIVSQLGLGLLDLVE